MYVLLDMEWIDSGSEEGETIRHITQLSAARLTAKWLTVSRVDYLAAPSSLESTDWDNTAYNGWPQKKFIKGVSERKAKESSEAEALERMRAEFQRFMDALSYNAQIVRVEEDKQNAYRVFYVSDRTTLDELYYPNFLAIVEVNHPEYQVTMRHIRDIDGHYVTIEEYRAMRGYAAQK